MVSKEVLNKIEEYLDERCMTAQDFEGLSPSEIFYIGVLKGVELSGLFWERDSEGRYKVYSFD